MGPFQQTSEGKAMLKADLAGVFPRSETLVEATRANVRGRLSREQLDAAFDRDYAALVSLQMEADLDPIVDGQLNWQDHFRPFSELFTGIKVGSLTRWFDNNTFYRQPIISGKIGYRGTSLQRYFRGDILPAEGRKKAVLPGPLTFAKLSQNMAYRSLADLVEDLARALKDTTTELSKAGYEYFQFDEPALVFDQIGKEELEAARRGFEICATGTGGEVALKTYFGDVGHIMNALLDFPVDCIGIDLYATSIESLAKYDFDISLSCGCVDGRNSLVESPNDLKGLLARVRDNVRSEQLVISPNCDLEFLPYSVAEKKVRLLSETRKVVSE